MSRPRLPRDHPHFIGEQNDWNDFLRYFNSCYSFQNLLARLTAATDKIKEAERYVDNVEKSINDLTPLLEAAKSELKTSEHNVKLATQEYHNSKQACVDQQKEVENLKQPIKVLREEAKEEFGKVRMIKNCFTLLQLCRMTLLSCLIASKCFKRITVQMYESATT